VHFRCLNFVENIQDELNDQEKKFKDPDQKLLKFRPRNQLNCGFIFLFFILKFPVC